MEPRLEQYLAEQHLSDQTLKVVPLTGDASDRRYFRVLLEDGQSVVLALHAVPIEFATLPFANVSELFQQVPLPVHKTSGVTVTHDDSRVYLTGWDSRNLIVIERLMPGIAPGKPSPVQASGKCERVPEELCRKYP